MTAGYIITIGRQFASGGHEIGQKIASRLGISFYDKELIRIASRESGLREEFFENILCAAIHSIKCKPEL